MKMYMGVLNAHDRGGFEINLIVDGDVPGAESGYCDHDDDRIWQVTGLSNAELAGHIANARIDVLVDLNGYSHQTRLPLVLHRCAPVQIAWNGMYGTTGFADVDVLVGDGAVMPPDEERDTASSAFTACATPISRSTCSMKPRTCRSLRVSEWIRHIRQPQLGIQAHGYDAGCLVADPPRDPFREAADPQCGARPRFGACGPARTSGRTRRPGRPRHAPRACGACGVSAHLRPMRHRARRVSLQRWHDDGRGAVAGRPGAHHLWRPMGRPDQRVHHQGCRTG